MNKELITKSEIIKDKYIQFKNKLIVECNNLKEKYKYLIKPFFILLILYSIALYPIVRVNFNYIDDLGRVNEGYKHWDNYSRFTSEYLSTFIHTSNYLTDISPLPQLIAVMLLALASVIILHLFKREEKITFLNIVSVISLGLSPYFLECLSYKYDSPYMALSILISVIPFLFYGAKKSKKIIFSILTIFCTIIMCTTYQAASGIIPMLALFLAFKYWNEKDLKEAIYILIFSAISFGIGLIIFQKFIMIPVDTYVSSSILPIKELIPGILANLKNYYTYVKNDFRKIWIILILAIMLCFILVQAKQSKQNKLLSLIFSVLLIFISGFVVFGLYPALEKPLFAPRAMYGYGVFIALIAVNATSSKKAYISKIIVFALCWCFFTFSFTYGNALSEQKRYIDFRVQSVINELNSMDIMNNGNIKAININGNAGKANYIDHLPEEYQTIINRLVSQSFSGDWIWNYAYFANYFKIKNITIATDDNSIPDNLETSCDTMYYKIETNNIDYILITLK
jgi:hypothetical protein